MQKSKRQVHMNHNPNTVTTAYIRCWIKCCVTDMMHPTDAVCIGPQCFDIATVNNHTGRRLCDSGSTCMDKQSSGQPTWPDSGRTFPSATGIIRVQQTRSIHFQTIQICSTYSLLYQKDHSRLERILKVAALWNKPKDCLRPWTVWLEHNIQPCGWNRSVSPGRDEVLIPGGFIVFQMCHSRSGRCCPSSSILEDNKIALSRNFSPRSILGESALTHGWWIVSLHTQLYGGSLNARQQRIAHDSPIGIGFCFRWLA